MKLGITGNTRKESLWKPIAEFVEFLNEAGYSYMLHPNIGAGLRERGHRIEKLTTGSVETFLEWATIIISFGGDGTLLNTVNELGKRSTPILGINYGRLGFLAHVEGSEITSRMHQLESGDYEVEERLVLEATSSGSPLSVQWALNEFTVQRSGETGLLTIEVRLDGVHLNTYWADGLIVSTPTGSTAYSLALGGPIMAPGCGSILITPIAPHSLTVRPVVIPEGSEIEIRILDAEKTHVFTSDGFNQKNALADCSVCIRRASHRVHLIRFSDQDYFSTLRTKLMWGARKTE